MSNQQATVNEQPSTQINGSKQVPFDILLPILIPQLDQDRAIELQTLFDKLEVFLKPVSLSCRFSSLMCYKLLKFVAQGFAILSFLSCQFDVICSREMKYPNINLYGL